MGSSGAMVALPTPGSLEERVSPWSHACPRAQQGTPGHSSSAWLGAQAASASLLLTPRHKSGKFPRTSSISQLICSHSIFGTGLVCRDFLLS